jgi:hypothetical protein
MESLEMEDSEGIISIPTINPWMEKTGENN